MQPSLSFEFKNQILSILFCRPEAGNSFGIDEAKALQKILLQHKKMGVRGLIFTSSHPTLFCAGGDLKAHGKLKNKKQGIKQAREIRNALAALSTWSVPKVAVVNGDCFGGGMELLSCFDHRIAAPHVMFGFWQRRISLSFGWGGFERWAKKISVDVIKDLGLSARVFGAHEALRGGIIQQIGGLAEAQAWLKDSSKWTLLSGKTLSLLDEKNERRLFEGLWWTDLHRAILKKFSK